MAKDAATTEYSDAVLKIFAAQDIIDSYNFDLSDEDAYINGAIILTKDRIGVFENDALKTVLNLKFVKKACCAMPPRRFSSRPAILFLSILHLTRGFPS